MESGLFVLLEGYGRVQASTTLPYPQIEIDYLFIMFATMTIITHFVVVSSWVPASNISFYAFAIQFFSSFLFLLFLRSKIFFAVCIERFHIFYKKA